MDVGVDSGGDTCVGVGLVPPKGLSVGVGVIVRVGIGVTVIVGETSDIENLSCSQDIGAGDSWPEFWQSFVPIIFQENDLSFGT